ncbi:hypothetical protein NE865_11420 [Phthorimaea operculella]|nr:hypothetical protein NE865_11420 [Phthorimaea operculella]
MKTFTLILATVVGLAVATPEATNAGVRNSALEQLLLGIIEGFRETMVTGSDDIPVLDPLVIDDLHLDLDDLGLENSHITLRDAELKYLSSFVIEDLSFTMTSILQQRYTLVVDGHIPVIDIDADHYDLSVSALGLNVFGTGNAKIRIVKPRIKATIELNLSLLGGISITIRNSDVPQITGLFGQDMTDDFINAFLRNIVPELVEFYQAEISQVINSIVEGIGSIDLQREDLALLGLEDAVAFAEPQVSQAQPSPVNVAN